MTDKKTVMEKFKAKLEKAIKREISVKREIENDNATLKYIKSQQENSIPLENEVYSSYEEWIEVINKQIKISESTLSNIDFKKVELEAVSLYLNQEN